MRRTDNKDINNPDYWDSVYTHFEFDGTDTYNHIIKHIATTTRRLIDLGCGEGRGLALAHELRPKVIMIGVDYSKRGIEDAKKKYPWGRWLAEDARQTSLPAGCADMVISSETLEHIEEPHRLVEEAFRLLEPGGRFLLTTPWRNHVPSDQHIWAFEYEDVEKMVKDAGFSQYWVFPLASGRCVLNSQGQVVLPIGNWDEIMALAIK